MLRILLTGVVILLQIAGTLQQSTNAIEGAFNKNRFNQSIESLKCAGVEGTSPSCLACFPCDHDKIKQRAGKGIKNLMLKEMNGNDCVTTETCCVSSQTLTPRNNENCGVENPEGRPRARRPSLRSVLERQYPWRAWVYSSNPGQKQSLCAASYLGLRMLLTTASCVNGQSASSLTVKFTKTESPGQRVKNLFVHELFDAATRKNDIAVLTLVDAPGDMVKPVCTPFAPAQYGTPCLAVSDSETFINEVIPQQRSCNLTDDGSMCTVSAFEDIKPQEGSGLFCLEENSPIPKYILYGVYLQQKVGAESKYINVTHYTQWIKSKRENIKQTMPGYKQIRN